MKKFFLCSILTIVLVACSSKNKTIISFAESDLGFSSVTKLMMGEQQIFDNFLSQISTSYEETIEENRMFFSLDEEIKVIVEWSKTGKKITTLKYVFSSNEALDEDLVQEMYDLLDQKFTGKLKDGTAIQYVVSKISNQISIEFQIDFDKKDEDLKEKVKKSIDEIKDADTLILSHFDGLQNIPEGKIWILKELHRCNYDAGKPDSNNLNPGTIYHCDGVTSDNYYYDLAINGTCMKLDGTMLTDGAWKKYPGYDISPEYFDPEIYLKVRLESFIILYPGMNISVSSPDQTGRRIIVQEVDIKKVKWLKDYIDFKDRFGIDRGDFEYLGFMNLQFWEYKL